MLLADPIAAVRRRAPARHRRRRGVRLPSRAAARSQRWRTRRRGRDGRFRASRTRGPATGGLAAVRACQIPSTVRAGRETLYGAAEKQTGEDKRRSIATVAKTVAKPLDGARRTLTTLECRPSAQTTADDPGRLAHFYGSDAHPGKRVAPLMPDRPVVSHWPEPAGQARLTCYADRRCPRPSSRRSIAPLAATGSWTALPGAAL